MKTKLFILSTFLFSFFACSSAQVSKVSNFSKISVSDGIDVEFTQSNNYTANIETDSENLPKVEMTVKNGTLEIKRKKGERFKRNTDVTVYVTAPSLEAIAMSGGSDFTSREISTNKPFSVAASGGADLEIGKLTVSECKLAFSGGADCEIRILKAKKADIAFSGGSDGEIGLDVDILSAAASGGADLELSGKAKTASVVAGGGSDIDVSELRSDNLNSRKSGGGTITQD